MSHKFLITGAAAVAALAAGLARADVFNLPAGETSLQFVTVGNAGNAADTTVQSDNTSGYGSVAYDFKMGQYDVTVAQYVAFLNTVASTADPYGLYSGNMEAASGALINIGIMQSYTKKNGYSYSFDGSADAQAGNCPMSDASWGDAARFCNWLQNGQPTGPEGPGTTETGAYTLGGATSDTALIGVTRNPGATYFIPSENEWYKAAYYNPAKGNYWAYPTQSNTAPSNVLSATGTDSANYFNGGDTDPTNLLTPVGAFAASPGPYGTYDMGGDVFQWNEAVIGGSYRGLRGGEWFETSIQLASSQRNSGYFPADDSSYFGFRVAASDPGDANGDGRVDINDLTIVLSNFGKTGCAWSQGSMDGDLAGRVDINDLTIVLSSFGQSVGTAAGSLSAVPEPGAALLLAAALVGLLGYARRKRT